MLGKDLTLAFIVGGSCFLAFLVTAIAITWIGLRKQFRESAQNPDESDAEQKPGTKTNNSKSTSNPAKKKIKIWVKWLLVVLILVWITWLTVRFFTKNSTSHPGEQSQSANYQPVVCDVDNPWSHEVIDHSNDRIFHFVVKLHEGCFGTTVKMPKGIVKYGGRFQPGKNADRNWWMAVWLKGQKLPPTRPFFWFMKGQGYDFPADTSEFLIQGKEGEEILFWSPGYQAELEKENPAPAKTPIAPTKVVQVYNDDDPGVSPPKVLSYINPKYTNSELGSDSIYRVRVWFDVLPDGSLSEIKIETPGKALLDQRAIEALKQWKFQPGKKDGKPVAVKESTDFDFSKK